MKRFEKLLNEQEKKIQQLKDDLKEIDRFACFGALSHFIQTRSRL